MRTIDLDVVLVRWETSLHVMSHTSGIDEVDDIAIVCAWGDIERKEILVQAHSKGG